MLSVAIIAKNEEKNIVRAIQSVAFADEILVIDDNSADQTALIAAQAGATILTHSLDGNFAAQRNYALEKAQGEWVLFIDADEVVGEKLKNEILQRVRDKSDNTSYYIPRRDWFWNNELKNGEVFDAAHRGIIRLVKKGSGEWQGRVHEMFAANGLSSRLQNHLDHYPHQTIADFLADINLYSTLRAQELWQKNTQTSIIAISTVPFLKFMNTYLFRLGFLEGPAGFVYSFMMSFHSFLVRAKLYDKNAEHVA